METLDRRNQANVTLRMVPGKKRGPEFDVIQIT